MARKGSLTEQQKIAAQCIAEGMSHRATGDHVGVTRVTVSRWYADPIFKAEVDRIEAENNIAAREERRKTKRKLNITPEKVIKEFMRLGFSDITEVMDFDADGVILKDSRTLPKKVTAAIASVSCIITEGEHGRTVRTTVKMHEKYKPLEFLAKWMGMTSDLNVAKAAFKTYGYKVVETDRGYELIDTYADEGKEAIEGEGSEDKE